MSKYVDICTYPFDRMTGIEPIAEDTETLGATRETNIPIYFSYASRDTGAGAGPTTTPRGFSFLQALCACPRSKIFHNAKFDMTVLEREGFEFNGQVEDTILMHMLLDEHHPEAHRLKSLTRELLDRPRLDELELRKAQQLVRFNNQLPQQVQHIYAREDARDTYDLFNLFLPQILAQGLYDLYRNEVAAEMVYKDIDRDGIAVNIEEIDEGIAHLQRVLVPLGREVYTALGQTFKISSPQQLGEVLAKHFPLHTHTPTGQYKTDAETLKPFLTDPRMQLVQAWKFLAKACSTLAGYKRRIGPDGRLHPDYRQTTVTGRSRCSDPNLQNIPHLRGYITEVEVGSKELAALCSAAFRRTRKVFVAAPGAILVSKDYKQLQYRCFAFCSGSERLLKELRAGKDFHNMTSQMVFGDCEPRHRHIIKVINYGLLFGMGKPLLRTRLRREVNDTRDVLGEYEAELPEMRTTQKRIQIRAEQRGYVKDVFNRRYRFLPERPHAVVAWLIQGSAANIKKYAMVRVHELLKGRRSRIVADIHDELIFEMYPEDAELMKPIGEAMEDFPQFSIPILTDTAVGPNLLELEEMNEQEAIERIRKCCKERPKELSNA